ncbi:MAG: 4-deoxy-4-formamido-L-arabinose-phosphoundecaprenol deformylase [Desulfarculales bacterium]|jgi:undecaprenyl phosphate-alpha-L-ara4FN deformylase|nr:4-deoxy-4-formamido-L-arabinose-phosphoundecaprenol deformylase [Desulfarculales bacterium]
MRKIGLRVDADTFTGTRDGTPRLLEMLARHNIKASFFFSVGPDNMGRHLWRLCRPAFLRKMLRSDASSLYGWDILLAGTAWPGRRIASRLGAVLRQTMACGHEIGLHAWDHYAWQTWIEHWPREKIEQQLRLGLDSLQQCLGEKVNCSASPGWRADQRVVAVKESLAMRYHSDCRGFTPFRPVLDHGAGAAAVQIPVSLPTFDEAVGRVVSQDDFNSYIMRAWAECDGTPVYTIHTEVEGVSRAGLFAALLERAWERGFTFCPLGALLPSDLHSLPLGRIEKSLFPGREGWLGLQAGLPV